MITNNDYRILGVNVNDDMSVIKAAYRRLASKYHPETKIRTILNLSKYL